MSYSSGMLDSKVEIHNRATYTDGDFGRVGGSYTKAAEMFANVTWTKGKKALNEGALEAYDYIMVRCRFTTTLTRESRLKYNGNMYQIESFHADKKANTIQITAVELPAE